MASVTHAISTASTSNAATYATGAFTPAAGDLLIVFAAATGTVATGTVSSSVGLTFSKITSATYNTSADTLYAFVSNQLAAATSQTVTFDCTGDNATGAIVAVARVAGVTRWGNGTANIRQSAIQNNGAAAGTPAPAFGSAALTGNVCIGVVGNGTNTANKLTPPTGWTEADDPAGYSVPAGGYEYAYINSGFTGTTVTWGSTSASAFGALILEIDCSVPPTVPPLQAPPVVSAGW